MDVSDNTVEESFDGFLDDDYLEEDEEDDNASKYLNLLLENENYGIKISYVIEIIGLQKITPLPEVPDFVKGVINLRGKIIPVLDVRLRFNLPEKDYTDRTCIIVVNVEDNLAGLVVDQVSEVIKIPDTEIQPATNLVGNTRHQFIKGLGKVSDSVKILLDINKLLNEKDFQLSVEKIV